MRLRIKSNTHQLKEECEKCNKDDDEDTVKDDDEDTVKDDNDESDDKEDSKNLKHCHCSLFKPSPKLLASVKDGQPYQRCKAAEEVESKKRKEEQFLGELNYKEFGGEKKEKADLKKEVLKMKRLEKIQKEEELKHKAKKDQERLTQKKQSTGGHKLFKPDNAETKKTRDKDDGKKDVAKRKKELEEQRAAKKSKAFLP